MSRRQDPINFALFSLEGGSPMTGTEALVKHGWGMLALLQEAFKKGDAYDKKFGYLKLESLNTADDNVDVVFGVRDRNGGVGLAFQWGGIVNKDFGDLFDPSLFQSLARQLNKGVTATESSMREMISRFKKGEFGDADYFYVVEPARDRFYLVDTDGDVTEIDMKEGRTASESYLERENSFLPPFKVNKDISVMKRQGLEDHVIISRLMNTWGVNEKRARRMISEYQKNRRASIVRVASRAMFGR